MQTDDQCNNRNLPWQWPLLAIFKVVLLSHATFLSLQKSLYVFPSEPHTLSPLWEQFAHTQFPADLHLE